MTGTGEDMAAGVVPPDGAGSAATTEGRPDRILTVPNLLSFGRLLCIPVFLWLLFGKDNRLGAGLLLAVLGATDWVDGYIARRFDQVSTLGKILDPAADRLLLGVGIIAILIDGSVPAWVAWAVIVREVAVGTLTVLLAALGARRIDVTWYGKAGTFALMVAFPLFLLEHAGSDTINDAAGVLAWPAALIGLALAWFAAIGYIPLGLEALRNGRQDRRAGQIGDRGAGVAP